MKIKKQIFAVFLIVTLVSVLTVTNTATAGHVNYLKLEITEKEDLNGYYIQAYFYNSDADVTLNDDGTVGVEDPEQPAYHSKTGKIFNEGDVVEKKFMTSYAYIFLLNPDGHIKRWKILQPNGLDGTLDWDIWEGWGWNDFTVDFNQHTHDHDDRSGGSRILICPTSPC